MEMTVGSETVVMSQIVDIAEKAGDIILDIYKRGKEEWAIEFKEGDEPLTVADKKANDYICEKLKMLHPSIPVISEEVPVSDYDTRKHFSYFWCVDPLDGTKEFIARNGEFTVNIGLVSKEEPIMGVVVIPTQSKTYIAMKGKGSFCKEGRSGEYKNIKAAEFDELESGLSIVTSRSHCNHATIKFYQRYKSPKFISVGSSIKFLLIAEGSAHVYVRISPSREWDSCAAHAIVNEAGGSILQLSATPENAEKGPLVYNKPDIQNPNFVAYGRRKVGVRT